MMKSKHNIKNKGATIAAAQTLGADILADMFWRDVEAELQRMTGEVRPEDVQRRQTREN